MLGAVIGGALFGLYLPASLNVLRIYRNEGFSSLACAHRRSFLTIRAIGVPRPPAALRPHPVSTRPVETLRVS